MFSYTPADAGVLGGFEMMLRFFKMTVIINAVELLKNNFDIREEARNTFIAVDYYREILANGMDEDDILEEYIDFFEATDPGVLFDKYITVDEKEIEYDFSEDAADEGQHRDCCFFKIPCKFDLEKYIKYMDQGDSKDAGEDDEIAITVYRETISRDLAGDDNLGTLIVKKDTFMKYFRERVLPYFKGDDETISEEGLLQEWLDEYTADDTTDLHDFIQAEERKAKTSEDKEYYQKLYKEKYDKLLEEAKRNGVPDPYEWANQTFDDCATAEEIAGYYISWYDDDAFMFWVENSEFYTPSHKAAKEPSELDFGVTRILGKLYDNIVVRDIEWHIPKGTPVSSKLSEVKVIPKIPNMEGSTGEEITEAIKVYLQLTYATEPKAFSFMLPDGRMAGYRNWELSSTSKKDGGTGCYGAGSEPCLNGCTGCEEPIEEPTPKNNLVGCTKCPYAGHIELKECPDAYTEVSKYCNLYNNSDFQTESKAKASPSDMFNCEPVDWIIGISGSNMDDVEVKILTGATTDTAKLHLFLEVQNIVAEDPEEYDCGTESVDEITVSDFGKYDGRLYAYVNFSDCHFDLTATPMPSVKRINY